ncbi:MAG: hypothetical protein IGS03_01935 [Candidatus Sericytochromatia bacterium]|nr:hypothetical protein [Candidatus Sericytochromatia bacterium]
MKKGLRRCAQCRIINDRRLMLRWGFDGRSWYFCLHRDCLVRAQKNKHLKQALQAGDGMSWLARQTQKLLR